MKTFDKFINEKKYYRGAETNELRKGILMVCGVQLIIRQHLNTEMFGNMK